MKYAIGLGIVLVLASLCAGSVGKLPDGCGAIADALDQSVLVAVNGNQVVFPLSGDLGYADAIKGLTKSHDDDTFRYYNVPPQSGDATTMADRAYSSGVLQPSQIVGAVGGILILVGIFARKGRRFNPSFAPI